MEENREPQQVIAAPVAYPPTYPAPQNPYYAPPPAKAGRWTRTRRTGRLLLRRLWYGSALVGRVARPYAAFIVVIIALLGVIGWMSYMLWGPKAAPVAFERVESLPPTAAIESFIKGQQNFNADMIWDSYSTDYQANQLAKGASKLTLQAEANNHRSAGLQYVHYDYIGGVKVESGSMYFYSVDLAVQNQHPRLWIIFRANQDGKIDAVYSPAPLLGSNLESNNSNNNGQ